MNSLIKSLEIFAINKDEETFDNNIDNIMSNLKLNEEEEEENDPDYEWELLKSEYSKIRYICQLLNHYHYILPPKFFNLLKIFTDSLDKTTNIYISLIDEDIDQDEELSYYYKKIKKNFTESLKCENNVHKIELLLKGYDLLVPIVEDFRKEKYYDIVDPEFEERHNPKRLKTS